MNSTPCECLELLWREVIEETLVRTQPMILRGGLEEVETMGAQVFHACCNKSTLTKGLAINGAMCEHARPDTSISTMAFMLIKIC